MSYNKVNVERIAVVYTKAAITTLQPRRVYLPGPKPFLNEI
jgi:hypothetical protein